MVPFFLKYSIGNPVLLVIILSGFSFAAAQDMIPSLKGDIKVHDPAMTKEGDTYYVFSTGKGIPFKTSKDRIHWKKAGRVFSSHTMPAWHTRYIPDQDGNLWAPDISYYKGKYYLYYAVSAWMNFHSSIGLATNTTLDPDNPDYKWVDQGPVITFKNGGEGVNVIDPSRFVDEDGKVWLVYGSYKAGLRLTRLNPATGKLLKDPPDIIKLTNSLGEGSCIIKGSGYYYLFASRGRCCAGLESTYQIVMGRSQKIEGPYKNKKNESLLDNKYSLFLAGDYREPGRGGNSFFTEGDTTFIVYHAYTRSANGASLLNIKPLYMDVEGWPSSDATGRLFKRETSSSQQYYLFCYFLQEHQGMCYAISTDGYSWKSLNKGRPYLTPEVGKQKLMRDPSINKGPDSVYRLVWTTGWHGTNIGYAYSKDLVHWSKEALLPVMAHVPGTTHCWAPEIFYDDQEEQYMVFWSSPVDSVWSIYYVTTKDFKKFSKPRILFTNGFSGGGKASDQGPIDAYIYKDTGRYVLFYKKDDNSRVPNLYYRFGKTPRGPWGKEYGPITPSTGDEGPSCIKVGNEYRVYTDPFESHNAYVYVSADLKNWKQEHTNLKMSHGTVLKISKEMAARLMRSQIQ